MKPRYDATGNQYAGVAETTFANYARDVRRLQKYIGDVRLGQLGVGHVATLRRRMEVAGETPENQRTTMVRLSTILNLAEARGDVAKNFAAARLVKRPKQAKRQHVQPREDDLTRLRQAVDGDPLEALVWIGLGAGLRRAELLGLRWEDIEYLNSDLGVLVVHRRVNYLGKGINRLERDGLKNGDPFKRVHIGSLMLDVLRMRWVHQLEQRRAALEPGQCRWRGVDYQPDTRTGFIFTNPTDGTPMNPRSADKAFAAIRDRAGLDIERFHALRHAFTTLLRASGTRDRVAMKMTGHRDAAMLDYYDEGLESEQIEAAQCLDERLRMLRDRP
jgi:integrase